MAPCQSNRIFGFQVSAYAIVTEYGDTCSTVDVKFYMFSPYNYGKDVW